ncbi:MAG: nitrogen fixation protein NifA [Bdellovibrionales bacterium GWC1_52_8]|nr:MAG: nitrogen fixation protein NifA [Bdellovibrionales bacterium GWA1_52_35]OFZ43922.1 MAG: nitrogen fixation protein NifA [Bdellovibrionales bacterium GWC1_52_8]
MNWEELKHIHVIRKLEEILGQWFHTDIFYVDDRGQVRNYDPTDRQREFRNPLCAHLLPKDKGRELIMKAVTEANELAYKSDQAHLTMSGPLGIEQFVISRITIDQDYLGSVFAYSYIDNPITPEDREKARAAIELLGMDGEIFEQALSRLKALNPAEKKYFYELVDLVAQEIVAFHTEISKREERISALNNQLGSRYSYGSMIGKSKPMQDLYSMLDKIKNSEATVLVQGENGTGKELIARAIHYNSPRQNSQFVTVNCSAFNENLLDSELFGHVKGSFTGAIKDKKGLFESADKGTLFLDEIGDMSPTMQVKLLRVLQEGTLTPVGGTEQRKVDVRLIAATNKDLKEMIELGTFREDLYYRINVINLVVPPLRDRKEDIPILVDHFLNRDCKEKNLPVKNFAKRAMEKIFDYPWPGNIRELENEVERVVVLSGDELRISIDVLSQRIRDFGEQSKVQGVRVAGKLKDALEELERTMIREGLRRTNWNKSRLAKELGISRAGLIMKVEKYGLDKRKIARAAGEAA